MTSFEKDLLNELLDIYEKSKLSKGGTKINRKIKLDTKNKSLKSYTKNDSFKYVDENNKIIHKLEDLGFINATYDNETFKYLTLNLENVDKIYDYLKRNKPSDELEKIKEVIKKYKFNNFVDTFLNDVLLKINEKYEYPKTYFKDSNELDLILKSFEGINSLNEEIKERDFSVKFLGDSKIFSSIKNKVIKIIKDYDPYGYLEDDDVLSNFNIVKNSSYVLIKNNLKFKINNQIIDLNDLKYEFSLSDSMIKSMEILDIKCKKIITVENLTSFYSFNDNDYLVIYLAGFHNHTKQELLKKIYEKYPSLEYYHFSDIDAGGFLIYMNLKEKTKIPFNPYKMSIEELENNKNNLKELTQNDIHRLELLKNDPKFIIFKDVIEYMLLNNVKLEQEILD